MKHPGRLVMVSALVLLAAMFLLVYAFAVAQQYGLATHYADQWRIVDTLLREPFPRGLLMEQNGHRPIFPNLVHYINLFVFKQSQAGLMWTGFLIAVLSAALLARRIAQEPLEAAGKVMLAALSFMVVLHISNGIILYHSNDSIHCYLVLIALVTGLLLLTSEQYGQTDTGVSVWGRCLPLVLLGVLGTFSFGTGAVIFPTFLILMAMYRRPRQDFVLLLVAGTIAVAVYIFLLPDAATKSPHHSHSIGTDNLGLQWLISIPRWISAPLAAMLEHSVLLQALQPEQAEKIVTAFRYWVGPGLSVLAFVYLTVLSLRALSGKIVLSPAQGSFLGLAIAMIAIGVLVAFTRRQLWHDIPINVFSSRFYVWSGLVWLSVICLMVLRASASGRGVNVSYGLAALLALFLVSSTGTDASRAELNDARKMSLDTALRASMGIDPGAFWTWIGVTNEQQILNVGRELKARGIPVFDAVSDQLYLSRLEVAANSAGQESAVIERLRPGKAGAGQFAVVSLHSQVSSDIVYVLDTDNVVVGILARQPTEAALLRGSEPSQQFHGYIAPYAAQECYRWAAGGQEGVYRAGVLRLEGGQHQGDCPG